MYLRQKENVHNYLFMYAHTRVYLEGDWIWHETLVQAYFCDAFVNVCDMVVDIHIYI